LELPTKELPWLGLLKAEAVEANTKKITAELNFILNVFFDGIETRELYRREREVEE
jgi:hypothetical protein